MDSSSFLLSELSLIINRELITPQDDNSIFRDLDSPIHDMIAETAAVQHILSGPWTPIGMAGFYLERCAAELICIQHIDLDKSVICDVRIQETRALLKR